MDRHPGVLGHPINITAQSMDWSLWPCCGSLARSDFLSLSSVCLSHFVDVLPFRYQPPNLAISTLYWKAWPLLLVVAAFNPENIGEPVLAAGRPGHGSMVLPWGPLIGMVGLVPVGSPALCSPCPRSGRLGGVPHIEDAHGDGDDQVSQLLLPGTKDVPEEQGQA